MADHPSLSERQIRAVLEAAAKVVDAAAERFTVERYQLRKLNDDFRAETMRDRADVAQRLARELRSIDPTSIQIPEEE